MKEIKFRAWDKTGKVMLPVSLWMFPNHHGVGLLELKGQPAEHEARYGYGEVELMQYTGLKDKNGVEIYEGDITNYGIVEWCECLNWDSGGSLHPGYYFKDKYEHGYRGDLDYHTRFDDDIEVIGNIYEYKG